MGRFQVVVRKLVRRNIHSDELDDMNWFLGALSIGALISCCKLLSIAFIRILRKLGDAATTAPAPKLTTTTQNQEVHVRVAEGARKACLYSAGTNTKPAMVIHSAPP